MGWYVLYRCKTDHPGTYVIIDKRQGIAELNLIKTLPVMKFMVPYSSRGLSPHIQILPQSVMLPLHFKGNWEKNLNIHLHIIEAV